MTQPVSDPPIYRDLSININEFTCLCKHLFRNEHGKPYQVRLTVYWYPGSTSNNVFEMYRCNSISTGDQQQQQKLNDNLNTKVATITTIPITQINQQIEKFKQFNTIRLIQTTKTSRSYISACNNYRTNNIYNIWNNYNQCQKKLLKTSIITAITTTLKEFKDINCNNKYIDNSNKKSSSL